MKKVFLSLILAAAMILTLFPAATASAEPDAVSVAAASAEPDAVPVAIVMAEPSDVSAEATQGDYTYSVTGGQATITGYTGPGGNLTFPDTLGGYPVTAIGDQAFYYDYSITGVVIPEGVTVIEDRAFAISGNLVTISLPESLISIGDYAFYSTGLTSVDIPANLTGISMGDAGAFGFCSELSGINVDPQNSAYSSEGGVLFNKDHTALLQYPIARVGTSYTIPSGVKTIGICAFSCCYLESVVIPDSVTEIGIGAYGIFDSCTDLAAINVDPQNTAYSSEGGVLFNKDKTLLLQYPAKAGTSYTIPSGVTAIGYNAFPTEGLTSVNIPANVTTIAIGENGAFGYCYDLAAINVDTQNPAYSSEDGVLFNKDKTTLIKYPIARVNTSYTIPSGVKTIEAYAFNNCFRYTKGVVIPDSVTEIGDGAFSGCQLLDTTIPDSVTKIGREAFSTCYSLRDIDIPAGTRYIGAAAFSSCQDLTSIDVDASNGYYTSADGVLFNKDKTTLLVYPAGKTGMTYAIPDTVTVIEESAFELSRLIAITIPDGVTSIRRDAFGACFELLSIEIPASVTEMYSAFYNCNDLTDVIFMGDCPATNYNYEFFNCSGLTIYYAAGKTGFPAEEWGGQPIYAFDPAAGHSIIYDANGGSGSAPADSNTYAYGEAVTMPGAGGLTIQYNYPFAGWNTEADGEGTDYAVGDTYIMGPHDVTLYAQWTSFTVTFDSQGGILATQTKTALYNETITPPVTTRTGYTFKGWCKEPECLSAWDFSTDRVTGNITIYAKWVPNTYTVTFNPQGGSAVASISAAYNTTITAPAAPERTGYTFVAWYKEAACTNSWNFDTAPVFGSTTLYARWNEVHPLKDIVLAVALGGLAVYLLLTLIGFFKYLSRKRRDKKAGAESGASLPRTLKINLIILLIGIAVAAILYFALPLIFPAG